jgi:hypothetical protein
MAPIPPNRRKIRGVTSVKDLRFLSIENVRSVEALARKCLASQVANRPVLTGLINDDREFSAAAPPKSVGAATRYSHSRIQRVVPVALAGFALSDATVVITGVAMLLLVPGYSLSPSWAGGAAGGFFTLLLFGVLVAGPLSLYFFRIPFEIGFTDEPMIELRSWLRTQRLSPYEVISIRTGGWNDPRALNMVIKYKGGKLCLSNSFSNFRDFLLTLKSLNPSVEIKGF